MRDRKRDLLDAAVRTIARRGVRGLRVEEVARDAGVSTALIYHHFGDRSTLLQNALLHVEQTAERYTSADDTDSGRSLLVATVLAEFQDEAAVRDNSAAWGELRDAAIFDPSLRPTLAAQTEQWIERLSEIVRAGWTDGSIPPEVDPRGIAQRLTALTEGLSSRWLSGLITTDSARTLLKTAVLNELDGAAAGAQTTKPE